MLHISGLGKFPEGNTHQIIRPMIRTPAEDFPNMEYHVIGLTNQQAKKALCTIAPFLKYCTIRILAFWDQHRDHKRHYRTKKNLIGESVVSFYRFIVLLDPPGTYLLSVDVIIKL